MKILVISPTFPPMSSGGADFAFRLCEHLAQQGHEVCVITSDIADVVASKAFKILPVMRRWSWGELPRLLKIARAFRPDAVDIHYSGGIYKHQPMVTCLATLLKRQLSTRVILHIEYPEPINATGKWSQERLIRKAVMLYCGSKGISYGFGSLLRDSDNVIVLCDTHTGVLAQYDAGVARKCVMIPPPPSIVLADNNNGKARQQGREGLRVSESDILLGYYGYIYPNKGIETLIEAFQLVKERLPNVHLAMVGGTNEIVLKATNRPHYLQELKDLAQRLGVGDRLSWTSYLPSDSDLAVQALALGHGHLHPAV